MKRIFALLLVLTLAFGLSACGSGNDDTVSKAITELKNHWKEIYDETDVDNDRYFEIKNTRVINIKENDIEEFKDVKLLVEFELYTDYFGSSPYYTDAGIDDMVAVYRDGTMKVQSNLINIYRAKYYSNDFSDFIESVEDYGNRFNCVEELK